MIECVYQSLFYKLLFYYFRKNRVQLYFYYFMQAKPSCFVRKVLLKIPLLLENLFYY
jgi:hypothetical protein